MTLLARKEFVLNLPFREIKPSDAGQRFVNKLQPVNHVDLSYLVGQNCGKRHVLVYELDGKILAFVTFLDMGDHFYLNLVEANQMYDEYKKIRPGFLLIALVESLSKTAGYSRVTLYSVRDRVRYYSDLGYKVTGDDLDDPNYGRLTPMAKSLNMES